MKNKLLVVCIIGILMTVALILAGCAKECEDQNGCHGIVKGGVFTGTSCGKSPCVIETMKKNATQVADSGSFVYCNCEE